MASPGSAVLEGSWQYALPWPEEIVQLSWDRAHEWKSTLRDIERESRDDLWVGFIAYEALACEEDVIPREQHPPEPPLFFARHRKWIEGPIESTGRLVGLPAGRLVNDSLTHEHYRDLVLRIRNAIRDGDVYQVNLTRAYSSETACDPVALYHALTGAHPPRCSAMIHGDGWSIASASPEVFLSFDRSTGIAESRPIKGTVRRSGNDDAQEIATLLASAKDAAEHLMIVDVVRNDFGKIAPPGCVSVPEFRAVHTLHAVHHLESTVRATGLQDMSIADVIGALAPAASITGAPKRAAVKMIRDIEPVPRGVYCGAIGMLHRGRIDLSVAIRTAVVTAHDVRYHAGGGIVWDSDAAFEDDECRAKADAFLRYIEGR